MEKKYNWMDGKMVIALGRTYREAHCKSMELFRENGLTMPQFTVLEVLYNKGDLTIQQIINKVLSSSGNMTVVIRNLEQLGLVGRYKNPDDSRSFIISITDKGRRLMDKVFPKHMENLANAFRKITDEEKETVVNILKKLKKS
ncbi:MAG: MarR family transcriptional regulator [Verrucomicrobiae bacterium]|nr:MarR family transcriptional regulator [Verrucomicrobiae bacterium]